MKKAKRYAVGYGKPPKHTRFKPGQSGNPNGRPKGSRSFEAEIQRESKQLVLVTENGKTVKISKLEAVAKSTFARAMKGDVRSAQLILKSCEGLRSQGGLSDQELDAVDRAILEEYRNG